MRYWNTNETFLDLNGCFNRSCCACYAESETSSGAALFSNLLTGKEIQENVSDKVSDFSNSI